MVSPKDCFSTGRKAGVLVAIVLVAALAACNPIETMRGITGMSRNDPDPATTPNTKNLAAGADKPYPNLATVPPPPTEAMTEAERNHLTQSLIADRAHPSYSATPETPGFTAAVAEPPPPPPPPPNLAAGPTAAKPTPAAPGAAKPSPTGMAARKPGEPPAPGPMESSLTTPQIPALPAPGNVTPPPPSPNLPSMPPPPAASAAVPAAKLATAQPQPPPAAPVLKAPPPPPVLANAAPSMPAAGAANAAPGMPAAGAAGAAPAAKTRAAVSSVALGALDFPGATTTLAAGDRPTIAQAAALYKAHPGVIRVTVYADVAAAGGGTAQLNSFQVALDRAHAIAAALTQAGVPADKVQTAATPAGGGMPPGHAVLALQR